MQAFTASRSHAPGQEPPGRCCRPAETCKKPGFWRELGHGGDAISREQGAHRGSRSVPRNAGCDDKRAPGHSSRVGILPRTCAPTTRWPLLPSSSLHWVWTTDKRRQEAPPLAAAPPIIRLNGRPWPGPQPSAVQCQLGRSLLQELSPRPEPCCRPARPLTARRASRSLCTWDRGRQRDRVLQGRRAPV